MHFDTNTTFWDRLAVKSYRAMLRYKPQHALLHMNLGLAYIRLGQTPQAIRSLKKAIQCDSQHLEPSYHLAALYLQLGNHKEALHYYRLYASKQDSSGSLKNGSPVLAIINELENII
ncbi:MAG: Anaphase-promoting complex, cyclosome, subunit 3 [Chlamydiales bacterium]|jgi:Tfp pilus assembly protein PilF|nr:Anaphase-promoting complex, cyclosome, subunit 3 [Chlamydiales bacterium]